MLAHIIKRGNKRGAKNLNHPSPSLQEGFIKFPLVKGVRGILCSTWNTHSTVKIIFPGKGMFHVEHFSKIRSSDS